jgi:glutamine amidotransferase
VTAIAIIDSGGANITSLRVGSAHDAMARLRTSGLDQVIPTLKQPLLGVCLGMQILFERSEEGPARGLGVIPGSVDRIQSAPGLPVPHMGWNQLVQTRPDPLLDGISGLDYVYFVHGFAAAVGEHTVASVDYGGRFTAVVRRDNFCGTQFHPERSGTVGARILSNFLKSTP